MYKIINTILLDKNVGSYWNIFQCEDTEHVDLNIEINSNVYEISIGVLSREFFSIS